MKGQGTERPVLACPLFLTFVSALVKTLAFAATAALIAAAVSYSTVPRQVESELAVRRLDWAAFQAEIEGRVEMLEAAQGGQPAQGGGPDTPGEAGVGGEDLQKVTVLAGMLAAQDRLVWAFIEVARQDWGSAAENVGVAAAAWEAHGFHALSEQARTCRVELARADPQGTARLRLLWSESQEAVSDLVSELAP